MTGQGYKEHGSRWTLHKSSATLSPHSVHSRSVSKQALCLLLLLGRARKQLLRHSTQASAAHSDELLPDASKVERVPSDALELDQVAELFRVLEDAHLDGHRGREVVRGQVGLHRGTLQVDVGDAAQVDDPLLNVLQHVAR